MPRALELAGAAIGSASPNPPVGAVVARDGRIVGEGSTQPAGQAHAETSRRRRRRARPRILRRDRAHYSQYRCPLISHKALDAQPDFDTRGQMDGVTVLSRARKMSQEEPTTTSERLLR